MVGLDWVAAGLGGGAAGRPVTRLGRLGRVWRDRWAWTPGWVVAWLGDR
ncbi:hypothetical protein LZG04_12875 [Saccharothrix sp. S26]|nr:hypothetical protein [Saccharothrix sp. S26]MCE6995688.1 hypothetical protein [Saccharothrix sp. S26]